MGMGAGAHGGQLTVANRAEAGSWRGVGAEDWRTWLLLAVHETFLGKRGQLPLPDSCVIATSKQATRCLMAGGLTGPARPKTPPWPRRPESSPVPLEGSL